MDKKVYKLDRYSEIYKEKAMLKDLCVVNGEFSINGFDSRFLDWQNKKEVAIEEELKRREELRKEREKQELKRKEEQEKQELTRKQLEKERAERTINAQTNIVQNKLVNMLQHIHMEQKFTLVLNVGKRQAMLNFI